MIASIKQQQGSVLILVLVLSTLLLSLLLSASQDILSFAKMIPWMRQHQNLKKQAVHALQQICKQIGNSNHKNQNAHDRYFLTSTRHVDYVVQLLNENECEQSYRILLRACDKMLHLSINLESIAVAHFSDLAACNRKNNLIIQTNVVRELSSGATQDNC